MRMKFKKSRPTPQKTFNTNARIRAEEVFLINEQGDNVGVIPTVEAIVMAEDMGLDLVEVNPTAKPPVAKIMDMGQFKYEREKKLSKERAMQKKIETKVIRLSVRISSHDFDFRLDQAVKFLTKKNKLRVEIMLRGREKQHPAKAREAILKFVEQLKLKEDLNIDIEQPLTKQGGSFSIILVNKS